MFLKYPRYLLQTKQWILKQHILVVLKILISFKSDRIDDCHMFKWRRLITNCRNLKPGSRCAKKIVWKTRTGSNQRKEGMLVNPEQTLFKYSTDLTKESQHLYIIISTNPNRESKKLLVFLKIWTGPKRRAPQKKVAKKRSQFGRLELRTDQTSVWLCEWHIIFFKKHGGG